MSNFCNKCNTMGKICGCKFLILSNTDNKEISDKLETKITKNYPSVIKIKNDFSSLEHKIISNLTRKNVSQSEDY